ncbi:MAG: hypothetical protein ACO1OO_16610 [Flavisolibacter sp.]
MERTNLATRTTTLVKAGQPGLSSTLGKQPVIEKRIADPSSTAPKGERYPIPSFFEYRIRPREFDML